MDIIQSLYIDNILTGCSIEEGSLAYYTEARIKANLNLQSWASNSDQLCAAAKQDQVVDSGKQMNVLGLAWNTISDIAKNCWT